MKLLFCADVMIGADHSDILEQRVARKWNDSRAEKLFDMVHKAAQYGTEYIGLFGQLFGQKRLPENIIDHFFTTIHEAPGLQFLVFINAEEFNRLSYRNDIPENLHLLCTQIDDTYADENTSVFVNKSEITMENADNTSVRISESNEEFIIDCFGEKQPIPYFEPTGFDNSLKGLFGYGILDLSPEKQGKYSLIRSQIYDYKSIEIKIRPEDTHKEILRRINTAVAEFDPDTVLRITLAGKSAFGMMINSAAIARQLQNRFFSVEVFDNTIMDIDEESFENDISLRSEFVRLAIHDDSLSESERNRIISFGWNALIGKEVSTE